MLLDYLPRSCSEGYTEACADDDALVHNVAHRDWLQDRFATHVYSLTPTETWTHVLDVELRMYVVCSWLKCLYSD